MTAAKVANGSLGTSELSSAIPAARVTRSADTPDIPSGIPTLMRCGTERFDTARMHSTNPVLDSRLTAPADGIYEAVAEVE